MRIVPRAGQPFDVSFTYASVTHLHHGRQAVRRCAERAAELSAMLGDEVKAGGWFELVSDYRRANLRIQVHKIIDPMTPEEKTRPPEAHWVRQKEGLCPLVNRVVHGWNGPPTIHAPFHHHPILEQLAAAVRGALGECEVSVDG
jgi:hypothetical protein